MESYIKYMDSKNNFIETTIEFVSFELAEKWMIENIENPNMDMINFF